MRLIATKLEDGEIEIVLNVGESDNLETIKDFLWAIYEGIGRKAITMDTNKDVPQVSIATIGD